MLFHETAHVSSHFSTSIQNRTKKRMRWKIFKLLEKYGVKVYNGFGEAGAVFRRNLPPTKAPLHKA